METAVLAKRIWAYIINLILYLGIGFASGVPFLILLNVQVIFYILISFGIAIIFSFFFDLFLLVVSKGYTIGTAILGIRYVSSDGKRINRRQAMVRSASESMLIFVIIDLMYFIKNNTERGVIDRLSNSFAIDTRL